MGNLLLDSKILNFFHTIVENSKLPQIFATCDSPFCYLFTDINPFRNRHHIIRKTVIININMFEFSFSV